MGGGRGGGGGGGGRHLGVPQGVESVYPLLPGLTELLQLSLPLHLLGLPEGVGELGTFCHHPASWCWLAQDQI